MKLRDLGEDEVIRRLVALMPTPVEPMAGPGDDCAVVEETDGFLLLKTDALVAGVHFDQHAEPERVGWKAIARVVSDFAAMGGKPVSFLITIAIDPNKQITWLEGIYRGMARCMRTFDAVLAGGETSSVPAGNATVISIAAIGRAAKHHLVLRSGGKPGDVLLVTGELGNSIRGKHLDFMPRIAEANWLAARYKPTAMMDLSDGLGADLPRLAAASGCGFDVRREDLPLADGAEGAGAWSDGEDFELLFSMPPEQVKRLLADWKIQFPVVPLTVIGALTAAGTTVHQKAGWDHFSGRQ